MLFLLREIPSQVKLTEVTLWRHYCFVRWYSQVDPEENQVNFVVCLARKQEIWRFSGGYYRNCASAQNGHLIIARSAQTTNSMFWSKFYFWSDNFFTVTYFHFHLSILGPVHTYMFTFVNAYFFMRSGLPPTRKRWNLRRRRIFSMDIFVNAAFSRGRP